MDNTDRDETFSMESPTPDARSSWAGGERRIWAADGGRRAQGMLRGQRGNRRGYENAASLPQR